MKINYLTILKFLRKESNSYKILCVCDCGKEKEFYLSNITPKPNARYTVSCGCKRAELVSKKNSKHHMSNTKFYKRWRSMFDRTLPSYIRADSYVGIKVENEWRKFDNFKNDMYESYLEHREKYGERKTTLDRINVYGNYCKENCRWATPLEQEHNKKRHIKD